MRCQSDTGWGKGGVRSARQPLTTTLSTQSPGALCGFLKKQHLNPVLILGIQRNERRWGLIWGGGGGGGAHINKNRKVHFV